MYLDLLLHHAGCAADPRSDGGAPWDLGNSAHPWAVLGFGAKCAKLWPGFARSRGQHGRHCFRLRRLWRRCTFGCPDSTAWWHLAIHQLRAELALQRGDNGAGGSCHDAGLVQKGHPQHPRQHPPADHTSGLSSKLDSRACLAVMFSSFMQAVRCLTVKLVYQGLERRARVYWSAEFH